MSVESERKVLEKLQTARNAVRRKYRQLQLARFDSEKISKKALEPISKPLEKLIDQQAAVEGFRRVDTNLIDHPANLIDFISPAKEPAASPPPLSKSALKIEGENIENALQGYLREYDSQSYDIDRTYGIRKVNNGDMKIGNSLVEFRDGKLIDLTLNQEYPLSIGFLELLFMKAPHSAIINKSDEQLYLNLLLTSKPYLTSTGKIKQSTSSKYTHTIGPMLASYSGESASEESFNSANSSGGSGLLPKYKKIARSKNTITQLVYWDNVNELVDRLRLLMAEKEAGNSAHTNEILAIIEELREGGYIL